MDEKPDSTEREPYFSKAGTDTVPFKPVDVRVLVRTTPNGPYHKLTKIVPYADGGFAVLVPYHKERCGWLAKMPVDYNKTAFPVANAECVNYSAEDRVKLSYHADGFVQFSSETPGKITSGRDPITGEPKGLGLITQPISDPIRTGPTIVVVAWPLADFEVEPAPRETDIRFDAHEMYYRHCTPEMANAVMLEGFVFHKILWSGVRRNEKGEYHVSITHSGSPAPGTVMDWKLVRLANYGLLGLATSFMKLKSPHPSGFALHGPGIRRPDGTGEVLNAVFPAPFSKSKGVVTALDRKP
jgi:hypothetical protein